MNDTEIRLRKLESRMDHLRRVIEQILKNANLNPDTSRYFLSLLSDGFNCEQEKHIHGDDCDCVHCEQDTARDNYMEASQKLEPDAYIATDHAHSGHWADDCAKCGEPLEAHKDNKAKATDFETHPRGTVEGLRAELDQAYERMENIHRFINWGDMRPCESERIDAYFDLDGKAIRGKHQ